MVKALHNFSDYQLLQAFEENAEPVFNVLFDRYFSRIYKFGHSLLNDAETSKELAMDVMMRLWQKMSVIRLEEHQDLTGYLFQSTKNAVLNHLRKTRILTQSLDVLPDEADGADHPADALLCHHELATLYEATLRKMPEQRRKIFLLNRDESLSYTEIAERLNLSVHTVRNQMSSSLAHFRKHLSNYDETATLLWIAVLLKVSEWP
ncbi:RNA polymerase sigma-70 factor [Parapedobacter deserti]|uniref:RNA polymerase sigma-70 factor n=1 Tax=Parapedobacter deserti TaxID=1912957 RepID=A0ABV7JKT5_9SPHI